MRYFFILGSNPALSAAEILATTHGQALTVNEIHKQALVLESKNELDAANLMSRLGGTVKIGRLMDGWFAVSTDILAKIIADQVAMSHGESKTNFGFSVYAMEGENPSSRAAKVAYRLHKAGMEAKRMLKEAGLSCRWVRSSSGPSLTSVVVEKNGLARAGTEFVCLVKGDKMMIGVTEQVQPFELFSEIDYGRPERDTHQGMLPPKLARIMLNLAQVRPGTVVWDPFCGSGTVLTEALRLGTQKVFGSDLNIAAVRSTERNATWTIERGQADAAAEVHVFENDARKRPSALADKSIAAIVTEPYLGPPRSGREPRAELNKRLGELTTLYRDALRAWRPLLADGAPIVMALPLYIIGLERLGIEVSDIAAPDFTPDPLLPPNLAERMGVRETANHGLPYGRNDQRVWREIVRLRLK